MFLRNIALSSILNLLVPANPVGTRYPSLIRQWVRSDGLLSETELFIGAIWKCGPHPVLSSRACPDGIVGPWQGPEHLIPRVPGSFGAGSRPR